MRCADSAIDSGVIGKDAPDVHELVQSLDLGFPGDRRLDVTRSRQSADGPVGRAMSNVVSRS